MSRHLINQHNYEPLNSTGIYSQQGRQNYQSGPPVYPQQNPVNHTTPYNSPYPQMQSQNFPNHPQSGYLPQMFENPALQNQYRNYATPAVQTQQGYPVTNIQNQCVVQNEVTIAPPADYLQPIPGYENTKFGTEVPILPPSAAPYQAPKRESKRVQVVSLSEDEARDALYDYASNECCYGKNVPKNMVVRQIENTSAYHYKLLTFTEGRRTAWKYKPHKGEPLLPYGPAAVLGPWDVLVPLPDKPFVNEKTSKEVPGTANIKICFFCNGGGVTPCKKCGQSGWSECSSCKGNGYKKNAFDDCEKCLFCNGRGNNRCSPCNGNGEVKCDTCKGYKHLKHFIELKVIWTTYVDDYIVERSNIPKELIKTVQGTEVFQEEQPMVGAYFQFSDNDLNSGAAKTLQQRVAIVSQSERILRQRHTLNVVPVSEVYFTWKDKTNSFFVYGTDQKVYAPDYPENCCYGNCSVL